MEEQQSTTSSTEPQGDRGRQSIRREQIHQIILFRDEWEMSWGQSAATLKLKHSTVQTAYNRWEKHGVFKRKMSEERGMMGSNNRAKPKTIKDFDLNGSSMNEIKFVYTSHVLNQFRSPSVSNVCINRSKAGSCTQFICLSLIS
jgi:hypothetical protein